MKTSAKASANRAYTWIALACLVIVSVVWGVTYERTSFERADDIEEAIKRNDNLALAFEEHTTRTLKLVDQALLMMKLEYQREGEHMPVALLSGVSQIDPAIYSFLGVVDRRGNLIMGTGDFKPISVADRDYFTYHRDNPGGALRIWGKALGRITGRMDIQVSRRVERPDGSFLGVVVAGINPDYFASFYDQVQLGTNGMVQLVSLEGVVLARNSASGLISGQDMRESSLLRHTATRDSGSFLSLGRLDGVARYQSFRVLREFGLVVSVGAAGTEVLADSRGRLRMYLVGSSVATLFVLVFGAGLIQTMRRQRRATQAALAGEALYRVTFDEAAVGISHNALDGRFLRANRKFCEFIGFTEQELLAKRFLDLLHPADRDSTRFMELMARGSVELDSRHVCKDGSVKWASVAVAVVHDANERPEYLVAMVQDITERKLAQERVLQAEAPYRVTFDQAAIGIVHTAPDGRLVKVNRCFATMLGYTEDKLMQRNFADVSHPGDVEMSREQARKLLADPASTHSAAFEKRYLRKDGGTLWTSLVVSLVRDPAGKPDYFLTMVQDISARKDAQARLQHHAHFDGLTGLPNRVLLIDRLGQAMTQARRRNWTVGVLFVDLDRFKSVNDTLGHANGDLLLREAGARLARAVRAGDTVARVGGDEFVVVLSEIAATQDAARVARKIIDSMAAPFELDGHEVFVTASVGIATYPGDGQQGETLVRNADAAMVRAKELGRSNYQFYTAALNDSAMERLVLEGDLRRALERREFRLHFQPRQEIASGRIRGFEALLRWQRAGNGLVPPGKFIPLLEESGLIVPVGEWVIDAACAQLKAWRDAGFEPAPLAVNVSAKQFLHDDLCGTIDAALRRHGVEAGLLEIEITESDAMQDPARVSRVLDQLKQRGIRIAIDDFGTGYSSLSYLKRFPIDFLKLDRSFVCGLPDDAEDASITHAVLAMARSLGLKVVAEGVETQAQRQFLEAAGCDQIQGYLLARPAPAAECTPFLNALAAAA